MRPVKKLIGSFIARYSAVDWRPLASYVYSKTWVTGRYFSKCERAETAAAIRLTLKHDETAEEYSAGGIDAVKKLFKFRRSESLSSNFHWDAASPDLDRN